MSPNRVRPLILVVEDEPRVSRYLRSSLQLSGHDVLVAEDGVKALEIVQESRPDLILLDLKLPKMGGFEVLENVRKQFDTPVIVLTAFDGEDDRCGFAPLQTRRTRAKTADDLCERWLANRFCHAPCVCGNAHGAPNTNGIPPTGDDGGKHQSGDDSRLLIGARVGRGIQR
jgi:CheY-like chemotaxis protein